jgi:DNA-binding IclR family transcriptional regulator
MYPTPRSMDGAPERSSDRAFRVLNAIKSLGAGTHSLQDILNESGLSRSTVQRVLRSGMREGIIMQSRHGQYSVVDFGLHATNPDANALIDGLPQADRGGLPDVNVVRCELSRLQENTGTVALLYSLVRDPIPSRCCIGVSTGPQTNLPPVLSIGNREPLGTDAPGLVILAHLGNVFPSNTRIRRIRTEGHAVTASRAPGWELLSVPILCHDAPVGAVGVSASPTAIDKGLHELVQATGSAAARIGKAVLRAVGVDRRQPRPRLGVSTL